MTEHGYNQSAFKRLERCGYPVHLLKTQYRMHPSIREFPSTQFYAGELEGRTPVAAKTRREWHKNPLLRPFVFMDVQGKEYQETARVVGQRRGGGDGGGVRPRARGRVLGPRERGENRRHLAVQGAGAEHSKATDGGARRRKVGKNCGTPTPSTGSKVARRRCASSPSFARPRTGTVSGSWRTNDASTSV